MAVAEIAATTTKPSATTASPGASTASTSRNGPKITPIPPSTAAALARITTLPTTGAVAINSGASSADTASQASPPPSCPAVTTRIGTRNPEVAPPL